MRPCLLLAAVLAACAHAPTQPSAEAEEIKELRTQLAAQSALVAQQQRRIEELEVKLAALAAKAEQQPAPAPASKKAETPNAPRPSIKRLGAGRRYGRDRINPVTLAPQLPSTVELREPDNEAMQRLDTDPAVAREFDADHAWAVAVQKLNNGEHADAETDFLAFVAAHPHHTAADNALYLAGLIRESRGDCAAALPLFEAVPLRYPAGDAVGQALLERGRCLARVGRKDEAKKVLIQLQQEHSDGQEAAAAKALLQGL